MKKAIIVFSVMLFVIVLAVQGAQDFTFSLSGGSVHGKFTLAGDFLYAQEFGSRFFVQAAGFANLGQTKEYGGSLGLGILTDEGGDIYLFADSLHAHGKFWTQLRPTARLRFSWMSLTAFYALPITKSTSQIDGQEVGAAKYWGGELNLVPVSWARVYGDLMSIGKAHTYKLGTEVRPLKWLSLSVDWNKTDSGIDSKWNSYEDVRVAINLLFGGQQQSFSPIQRVQVTPMYPMIVRKNSEVIKPNNYKVEFKYVRIKKIINPTAEDLDGHRATIFNSGLGGGNTSSLTRAEGKDEWFFFAELDYSPQNYYIWLIDRKVESTYGESIAEQIFARAAGTEQWTELPVEENRQTGHGKWAKFIWNNGVLQIPK